MEAVSEGRSASGCAAVQGGQAAGRGHLQGICVTLNEWLLWEGGPQPVPQGSLLSRDTGPSLLLLPPETL